MTVCEPTPDPTCEDKRDDEAAAAAAYYRLLCENSTIETILKAFITPPWVTDSDDQRKALARYLTTTDICHPQNNNETVCVNCAAECGDCSCSTRVPTGCPTEGCPSKFYGYGLFEVIRAAIRADSMAVVPYADLDKAIAGDVMVWDPQASPDNIPCDPCSPRPPGAWTPYSVYRLTHNDH